MSCGINVVRIETTPQAPFSRVRSNPKTQAKDYEWRTRIKSDDDRCLQKTSNLVGQRGRKMQLFHLVYTSRSIVDITDDLLRGIQRKAAFCNQRRGVTGALLCSNRRFIQLLEGASDDVADTFATISLDPRHTDVCCVYFGMTYQRMFPQASMGVARPQQGQSYLTIEQLFKNLALPEHGSNNHYVQIAEAFKAFEDQVDPGPTVVRQPDVPKTELQTGYLH
jgi:hypothetical protein